MCLPSILLCVFFGIGIVYMVVAAIVFAVTGRDIIGGNW